MPLPDGPMSATNSPAATDRETPRSASTVVSPSGYDLVRSRASRIGPVAIGTVGRRRGGTGVTAVAPSARVASSCAVMCASVRSGLVGSP